MENRKIRVNTGIVINVNDNGDTIVLNVEDQNFLIKYYELLETLNSAQAYAESEEYKNLDEKGKLNGLIEQTKKIMNDIDLLFGENACKKVFGDIIPNTYLIADFFDQLMPIMNEYAGERDKRISSKYNRSRKGGAKK